MISCISLLCFSCGPPHQYQSIFYSPDEGNTLGLREKGDVHLSGSILPGLSGQLGYSPIKHLGISTSYAYASGRNNEGGFEAERYKHHLLNGAVGGYYFLPPIFKERLIHKIGLKKPSRKKDILMKRGHLFESYLGYSRGKVFNYYQEGGNSTVQFRKPYLHFGWHRISDRSTFSWTYRYSHLNVMSVRAMPFVSEFNRITLNTFESNNNFPLHETSVKVDFGGRKTRFYISASSFLSTTDLSDIGMDFFNLSVGFIYEIDESIKDRRSNKL